MREPSYVEIRPRTRILGRDLVHLHAATSTQEVAWNRGRQAAPDGLVVVADQQTKGQGRRGRSWTTLGTSLYATVLLRPNKRAVELQLLPLIAGAAAAEAIERLLRVDVGVKWPNDLVHEGKKLGGVLVDAVYGEGDVPQYVLVGLGVNGDVRENELPPELATTATSLSMAAGRHVCLPALLKLFLESLERRYLLLLEGETEALLADVRNRLLTLGRRVRVQTSRGPLEGLAKDLGPDGELLVEAPGGAVEVRSGECLELRDA